MRLLSFLALVLLCTAMACKNKPAGQMMKAAELADLPQDFLTFYQKFHSDSAYQMAHITWPLKGEKSENLETGGTKKVLAMWEPQSWQMLHLPDMSDVGLKRTFEAMSDVLISERLQYPMVNFGMERQFYKDENNEWNMIFYSEMQELK
jgi:hypothetical protein